MQVTITEAKNTLTRLIHQAEVGVPVYLTRRGKPVAVLLSAARYQQLVESKKGFWQSLQEWRKEMIARGVEFPNDEDFTNLRAKDSRRELAL
ncbi:MAG: type II toxin-antitoxin system Phd/YefM family antitoxin [Gammaproteobacteria bacterium]